MTTSIVHIDKSKDPAVTQEEYPVGPGLVPDQRIIRSMLKRRG